MATETRWSKTPVLAGVIDDGGVHPSAKGLANGSAKLSAAIDNAASLERYVVLKLRCRGASAFSTGGQVTIWLVTEYDSSYEDGSDSVIPAGNPVFVFGLRTVSTQQVMHTCVLEAPPCRFKLLIQNNGGQAFTNTDDENELFAGLLSDKAVAV